MNILEIKNLSKVFGEHLVLDNVSLSINEGDIYGILGLSGAGKSTLVRCINGLENYDLGSIYYKGEKVTFTREYRRNVAMIFQQFNLLQQRTVLKNVELAGEIVHDNESHLKAIDLLNRVGLSDKLDSYPSQLSGGQQQRVAIARALMTNPKILLCDEATSALDPDTTKQILELLKELNKSLNLTIIIISHQMSVIEEICNKVAIIDHSKIVECGPLYDVFLSPKTDIAKKLIYSGHVNTKLDNSKYIKLIFNGEIDTPLLANIVEDCHIQVSIVYADSRVVDNRVYGQLIIKKPTDEQEVKKLIKYLKLKKILYEEVDQNGLG